MADERRRMEVRVQFAGTVLYVEHVPPAVDFMRELPACFAKAIGECPPDAGSTLIGIIAIAGLTKPVYAVSEAGSP